VTYIPLARVSPVPIIEPECLPEGRKFVILDIDFSQLPVQPLLPGSTLVDYPEVTININSANGSGSKNSGLTPPVAIPAGQSVAWAFAGSSAAGGISMPDTNGTATATNTGGEVTMNASGPLGNPGFTAIWGNFNLNLPPGAVIKAVYPVMFVNVQAPATVPEVRYGNSTVGALAISQFPLLGNNLVFTNPDTGQVTTAASIGTTFDESFQLGIQLNQTTSQSGLTDSLSASFPAFAVYYQPSSTGGSSADSSFDGFQVWESSLDQLTNGPILSQCVSCLFHFRPQWGTPSYALDPTQPSADFCYSSSLISATYVTSVDVGQTFNVPSGSDNSEYGSVGWIIDGCVPFFLAKTGNIRIVRLLQLGAQESSTASGRLSLTFSNFALPPFLYRTIATGDNP
jgi:hypothetical protein